MRAHKVLPAILFDNIIDRIELAENVCINLMIQSIAFLYLSNAHCVICMRILCIKWFLLVCQYVPLINYTKINHTTLVI